MNRRRFLHSSVAGALALAHPCQRLWGATTAIDGDLEAVAGNGAKTVLEKTALQNLRASLRGSLFLPHETGYDEARRVLDQSIEKRPALVVQPSGVADIRTAVDFARTHALLLAVKCGGHSGFRSTCEGGMQIDLSRVRGVRVDPRERVAHVAGGSLLGDVDHESMAFGLATPAGVVSHTGVGGLTLGAGFGRLGRRHGLTLDNVLGVDIVTTDGQLRRADAGENTDLYWAVRGGGGNFGIVTNFDFRLHPMRKQVIGGRLIFPLDRAREVLDAYADFSSRVPDELYAEFIMGERCSIDICWSGDPQMAEKVLEPIRSLGAKLEDGIRTLDFVAQQRNRDRTDPLNRSAVLRSYRIKTGFLRGFDPGFARAMVEGFEPHPERRISILIQHAGGQIGRIAPEATAFPHRGATHVPSITVSWPQSGDGATHLRYLDNYWATLNPFTDGYYTNLTDQEQSVVDDNYRGNLPRLQRVKARYDPTNLFRLNANIRPAASG